MNIPKLRLNYFPNTIANKLHVLNNNMIVEEFEEDLDQISTLCIDGNEKDILSSNILGDLYKFRHLNVLSIPSFLIGQLKKGDIPNSVSILKINIPEKFKQKRIDIIRPDVILPNVKSIIFSFSSNSIRIDNLLGISPKNFPNLEYLNCRLDKKGKILDFIKPFKSLLFLEVEFVGNNPLFESISAQLKTLVIVGADHEFQINDISKIKNLEAILLNGIKSEINCSVFTFLSNLKELSIWNSKKIINIESLLNCKYLKNISVINCGNPFRKLHHRFNDNQYNYLDIKYS